MNTWVLASGEGRSLKVKLDLLIQHCESPGKSQTKFHTKHYSFCIIYYLISLSRQYRGILDS